MTRKFVLALTAVTAVFWTFSLAGIAGERTVCAFSICADATVQSDLRFRNGVITETYFWDNGTVASRAETQVGSGKFEQTFFYPDGAMRFKQYWTASCEQGTAPVRRLLRVEVLKPADGVVVREFTGVDLFTSPPDQVVDRNEDGTSIVHELQADGKVTRSTRRDDAGKVLTTTTHEGEDLKIEMDERYRQSHFGEF